MAEKRMFSNKVIGSDAFLEMPDSSQNLYFHLSMYADDDGFVDKPKSIMRMTGKKEDDMKILIAKSFIIPFESGVIVIKHWRVNNYLRNDRYKETQYLQEKQQLAINKNGEYEFGSQLVYQVETQNRIEKNSKEENRIEKNSKDSLNEILQTIEYEPLKTTLQEFIKMRRTIKKPLTPYGLELLLKNLNKLTVDVDEQVKILEQSISNCWQGVFALKDEKKEKKSSKDEAFDKGMSILNKMLKGETE